eukprot:363811-Chlamydomonas_euryale.AAC.8
MLRHLPTAQARLCTSADLPHNCHTTATQQAAPPSHTHTQHAKAPLPIFHTTAIQLPHNKQPPPSHTHTACQSATATPSHQAQQNQYAHFPTHTPNLWNKASKHARSKRRPTLRCAIQPQRPTPTADPATRPIPTHAPPPPPSPWPHTCTAPRYPRSTMDPRDSTNVEWAGRITTHAMMKPARHKRVAQLTGTRRAKRGSHATQRDRAAGHRFPASCSTLSNGIAHQSHTWAKEPSCADASLTIVNTSTTSCSQHHLACRSAWRTHAGKRTTTWAAQASGAARRSQPAEIDRTAERNNSEVCGRSPASCSHYRHVERERSHPQSSHSRCKIRRRGGRGGEYRIPKAPTASERGGVSHSQVPTAVLGGDGVDGLDCKHTDGVAAPAHRSEVGGSTAWQLA